MRTVARSSFAPLLAAIMLVLAVLLSGDARAQVQPPTTVRVNNNPGLGLILIDHDGLTLYMRTTDMPAMSGCTGSCTATWPPLQPPTDGPLVLAAGVNGTLDAFTRDDGTLQVEYDGIPLYHFAGDVAPGDINGQGIGGVWFAAQPESR